MKKSRKRNQSTKNRLGILLILTGLVVIYLIVQTDKELKEPEQKLQEVEEVIETPTEIIEEKVVEEEPEDEISVEVKELLSLADKKINSIRYKYQGPQTKSLFYEFFVKGDKIKYTINPTFKSIDVDEDSYDTIYLNGKSKTALAYCDNRKCRVKGKKAELDYDEAYIWTPLDWISNVEYAEKTGQELIDRRNTWILETRKLGTIWVDLFFGVPLQIELSNNIYKFEKISFNDVKEEDVEPLSG